jgi:hypothetical protein
MSSDPSNSQTQPFLPDLSSALWREQIITERHLDFNQPLLRSLHDLILRFDRCRAKRTVFGG